MTSNYCATFFDLDDILTLKTPLEEVIINASGEYINEDGETYREYVDLRLSLKNAKILRDELTHVIESLGN